MSALTERNWTSTLARVYEKSLQDPEYRSLCVSDPLAAIKAVSDIEIPPEVKIRFYDNPEDYVYTFLLPKPLPAGATPEDVSKSLLQWATDCTNLTTNGPI